jgi:thiamine biosynthesis lipoprotein
LREAKGNWANVTPEQIAAAKARMGVDRLVLDPADFSISVTKEVEVDLGAIGKGFALDKASEILAEWSITDALLHCGPSTALALGTGGEAGGCPAGREGWPVGVGADWGHAAGIEAVLLHHESVSGSGVEVQGHHVMDPRTATPARGHVATWAVAPTAALSDAFSTAFMVMSLAEVKTFCSTHPEVGALVVGKRRGVMRVLGHHVLATKAMLDRRIRPARIDRPVAAE